MGSVRITLDELVALSDEMAALARAGLPLERGLRSLSGDLPGRLGCLANLLSERLERGQSLAEAIAQSGDAFSPAYAAVVAAGLRSGRLAAALEGVSTTIRRVAELRRTFIVAMVYPLIVLAVASVLFSLMVLRTAPDVLKSYEGLGLPCPAWYQRALSAADLVRMGLPWFWCLLAILVVAWLYRSARAVSMAAAGLSGWPTIAGVLRAGRMATFAELLSLMVEHNVPMDEAVELSAAASGDGSLRRSASALAEQIRAGQVSGDPPPDFPSFLGWMILSGTTREHLVRSLRQTAEAYRRKANYAAGWLGVYLPILVSAAIGGTAALLYVLLALAPFYHLLYQFGKLV